MYYISYKLYIELVCYTLRFLSSCDLGPPFPSYPFFEKRRTSFSAATFTATWRGEWRGLAIWGIPPAKK